MAKTRKRIKACKSVQNVRVTATSKRKTEASKKLAYWASIVATGSAIASYTLAFLGLDPVSELTATIFTACIGYLITYAAKSLGEKVSRNLSHLDADGYPLESAVNTTVENEEETQG